MRYFQISPLTLLWCWLAAVPALAQHSPAAAAKVTAPLVATLSTDVTPDNHTKLVWVTGAEVSPKSFVVERSEDGQDYTPISKVAAEEPGCIYQVYVVLDSTPLTKLTYYRLRHVAADQTSTFSPVEMVQPRYLGPRLAILTVWPSLVSPSIPVTMRMEGLPETTRSVRVRMYSAATARTVWEGLLPAGPVITKTWTGQEYATPGLYIVEATTAQGQWRARLLVE